MTTQTGRCLCGKVAFTAELSQEGMDACHCAMCRRWSAGPFMGVGVKTLIHAGEAKPAFYRSSDHGERGFCPHCGTVLFWRMVDGSFTTVSAQALDDPDTLPFHTEIFVDEKPDHYAFAGERKRMTGPEVIAAFLGGGGEDAPS